MQQEIIDIEKTEVETVQEETNALKPMKEETGITADYLKQLDFVANNIDRFVTAQDKIWRAILKIAKEGDWVIFGDDRKESVCLSGPGAERIASRIGVSFNNWQEKKDKGSDEKGDWYRYWFECDASFGGRTVRAIGRASSRDKFFGRANGQWKELSDIPEDNIRMAAFRGAMKEGVRILFGLRNIPKEEFLKAGIPLINTSGHKFQNKNTSAPENKEGEKPSATLECSSCAAVISQKVHDFSKEKHGKALCMKCQEKVK